MVGDARAYGPAWLFPTVPDETLLWLIWLVRLRWVALFAQAVTLAFVWQMLPGAWAIATWLCVMGAVALGNGVAIAQLGQRHTSHAAVLAHLIVDVLALTAFFGIAGGPDNPFVLLYLVHIAMGAVMLPPAHAAGLGAAVLVCFSLLFPLHVELLYENHSLPALALRSLGQWLAFGITSLSVSFFVVGIARTLRQRKVQLLEARDRTARTDRLRSLGTLAAGAAHELNTPLSTVSLRVRRIGRRHTDADTARDLEVIRDQLDRCTGIVRRLLVGAGDPAASDIARRPLVEMVEDSLRLWKAGAPLKVSVHDTSSGVEVELPQIAFQQALINLLENAREAQQECGAEEPIELRVRKDGDRAVVEVLDRGCGLPDKADQVGEPFFTTKPTGTGLGVFVARQIADGAGGGLTYHPRSAGSRPRPSADERGTVARWWFPEAPRRSA